MKNKIMRFKLKLEKIFDKFIVKFINVFRYFLLFIMGLYIVLPIEVEYEDLVGLVGAIALFIVLTEIGNYYSAMLLRTYIKNNSKK